MKTKQLTFLSALVALTLIASSATAAHRDMQNRPAGVRTARPFVATNTMTQRSTTFRHRTFRNRTFVFVNSGFGFPFFYPYPYYYYPYGYYYYNQPAYGTVSIVVEVQTRLARAGYYHGRIDGVMGTRTRAAIRVFERAHGLRVDGVISRQLIATMGLRTGGGRY